MRSLTALLAGGLLLASACSGPVWVKPTPAGAKVRVTNIPDVVRGCDFRGNVTGTGFYGPDEAIAIMQNKTAELGGNVVFVSFQGTGKSQNARGEAYSCPQIPATK
jgi:hypothetical protein